MQPIKPSLLRLLAAVSLMVVSVFGADRDNDGLRDEVETATDVFVSDSDTGTSPDQSDSDGDHVPDGIELNSGTNPTDPNSRIRRPNIIFMIADDLAYGDVGCFWQNQRTGIWKFSTPGLDSMASQGAMMTHHYAASAVCASSRASFFLGQHQGNALIRDAEFDRPLPENHNVAGMLKSAGYRTIHIGKAGLAGTNINPLVSSQNVPAHPLKRGFDRFFGYLRHEDGHEHYPRNGTAPNLAVIHDDYRPVTDAYQDLYTCDAWTAFAKKTIIEETQQNPDRPFFLYLAYDTPHFYGCTSPTKTYPPNKGVSGGVQWMGAPAYASTAINDPNRVNNIANIDPSCHPSWFTLAKYYVSMIRRLDDSVSDILQTLRDLGIDDNTIVVFTSDNGSSDKECGASVFQSSAAFEGAKFDIWEGGRRVPTIAWGPGIVAGTNQLQNIRNITHPSAGYDWMATFAELAKVPVPATSDGISQMPVLSGIGTQKHQEYLFFDLLYGGNTSRYPDFPNHGGELRYQMQSIRIGDMVGVRNNIQSPTDRFRIYNIVSDSKQSQDLAPSNPDLQDRMQRIAVGSRRKGVPPSWTRIYDNARIPSIAPTSVRSGVNRSVFSGFWTVLPDFEHMVPVSRVGAADISASPIPQPNDFGLSYDGYISISTAGNYVFETTSSGPTSLLIHGGIVIDNDIGFTSTRSSSAVNLSAGLHPFRLNYRHANGSPSLQLKYSGPGIALQQVPSSSFFVDGIPTKLLADSATCSRGGQALIDVVANDTSEAGLTVTSPGSPAHGIAAIQSNRVIYEPSPGFIGVDTFEYEVSDGWNRHKATITVTVVADGEIWFPLDEGHGFTTNQAGGSATGIGTLSGPSDPVISWVKGKVGKALRFRGVEDIVHLQGINLPQASAPRTFTCWLRTTSSNPQEKQAIFSYGGNGFGQRFTVRLAPSPSSPLVQNLRLETEGGVYSGSTRINDGYWHQISVTVSDRNSDGLITIDETRFFVDGNPDNGRVDAPGVVMTGTGFAPSIGGSTHSNNYNFIGEIDDVRIFDKEIQPATIAFLATTLPVTPTSGTNVVVSQSDFDGDRFSNEAESTAGTDAEDPGSYPRITGIMRSGSGVRLTWMGIAGRTYWIEESPDLKSWSPATAAAPVVVDLTDADTSITVPGNGASARFFRLRVEETPVALMSNAFLPPLDQDKDGASDEAEYIAGTDPFNPSSVFSMKMARASSGSLQVNWSGVAGRTYRMEESNDLKHWRPVPAASPVVVTQSRQDIGRSLPHDGSSQRFLRIAVSLSN